MQESIYIKNLGPIKEIRIDSIKPLTVLVGESGSGKSTLMKCISMFRYLFKMENIRSYLFHSKISRAPFRLNVLKHMRESGLDEFIKSNTYIKYIVRFSDDEEIILSFDGTKSGNKYNCSQKISSNNIQLNKISFITENRNIIPLWASRGASLAGGYLGFYFHEVYKDFELATNSLRNLDLKHINVEFYVKKSNKGKEYKISSNTGDYDIQFKNSSSGTQSSVPISLITKYFTKYFDFEDAFNRSVLSYLSKADSITDFRPVKNLKDISKSIYIHIEEPELSLYPDAQFLLIEDLINDCFLKNSFRTNLLFSTHSPYIINHLNLLIRSYDKNVDDDAKINFDNLAVFEIKDGVNNSLLANNERLVDTNILSTTINKIYQYYNEL